MSNNSNRRSVQMAGDKSGERSIVSSILEEEEEEEEEDLDREEEEEDPDLTVMEDDASEDSDDDDDGNDDDLSETACDEEEEEHDADQSTTRTYRSDSHYTYNTYLYDDQDHDDDDDRDNATLTDDDTRDTRHRSANASITSVASTSASASATSIGVSVGATASLYSVQDNNIDHDNDISMNTSAHDHDDNHSTSTGTTGTTVTTVTAAMTMTTDGNGTTATTGTNRDLNNNSHTHYPHNLGSELLEEDDDTDNDSDNNSDVDGLESESGQNHNIQSHIDPNNNTVVATHHTRNVNDHARISSSSRINMQNITHGSHNHTHAQNYLAINQQLLDEAEQTFQQLLRQYDFNTTNAVSNNQLLHLDQYKDALMQLSTKWEQIQEQIAFEHERQLEAIVQERNDLELEIHHMERSHRDEIDITKQQVMEQSQRIIMQEMKDNADREIKSEATIDLAVKKAVQETKDQMNQEFQIALQGMTDAQAELQQRYERIIKETKVRVTHDIQQQANKHAEIQIQSFQENYNHLKQQVVELTMELEKKNHIDNDGINTGSSCNHDSVIQDKEEKIEFLNQTITQQTKQIQSITDKYEQQIKSIQSSFQLEKSLLSQKIAVLDESKDREYKEKLDTEIQKAIKLNSINVNKKWEVELSSMKSNQAELEKLYQRKIKETQIRVRNEIIDTAKKEAEQKISALIESYDEMKAEKVELIIEIDKLKSQSKKIQNLEKDVSEKEKQLTIIKEKLQSLECKNNELMDHIHDIQSSHESELGSLSAQIETMTSNCNELTACHEKELLQLTQSYEDKLAEAKNKIDEINIEMDTFKSKSCSIQELNSIIKEKDAQIHLLKIKLQSHELERVKFDKNIRDMESLHDSQLDSLNGQLETLKSNASNTYNDLDVKFDKLKDSYEPQLAQLRQTIDEKVNELAQKDFQHAESLRMATATITEHLTTKYENKIETLQSDALKNQHDMEALQEKYTSDRNDFVQSSRNMNATIVEHESRINSIMSEHITKIDEANKLHQLKIESLKKAYAQEVAQKQSIIDSIQLEKVNLEGAYKSMSEEMQESLQIMKVEHRTTKEQMKLHYMKAKNELNAELMKLKKENETLRKDNEIYFDKIQKLMRTDSAQVAEKSANIVRNNTENNELDDMFVHETKNILLRSMKYGEDDKENSHTSTDVESPLSALKPLRTPPPKNQTSHSFQDLSPLTVGSPTPTKPKARMESNGKSCSSALAKTAFNLSMKRSCQAATTKKVHHNSPSQFSHPSGFDMRRNSQARISSKTYGGTLSKPLKSFDSVTRRTCETPNIPSGVHKSKIAFLRDAESPLRVRSMKKAFLPSGSKRAPFQGAESTSTPKTTTPTSSISKSPVKIVDKTPNRIITASKRKLSSSAARRCTHLGMNNVRNMEDVCVMFLNVVMSDKIKKMAQLLRIKCTENPLEATHVVVGDNHIRRTAKFMAVLNITSNILRFEWFEDSCKKNRLLGCSRYLLLNDSKAEKLYSFSMKQTLVAAKERRSEGGLLTGWKVLVCENVAGNKAPHEEDFRMMIEAAGGEWLLNSNVPVPISEDPTHVIVITSDPALLSQTEDEKASLAAENGAGFFTTTWLFECMMHQKV